MKITHTFRSGENVCQLSLLFSNFQISKIKSNDMHCKLFL